MLLCGLSYALGMEQLCFDDMKKGIPTYGWDAFIVKALSLKGGRELLCVGLLLSLCLFGCWRFFSCWCLGYFFCLCFLSCWCSFFLYLCCGCG